MSAFLCNPAHIGALAQFTIQGRDPVARGNPLTGQAWDARNEYGDDGAALAVLLGRENLASIGARYPDADTASDWGYGSDADYLAECSAEGRRRLTHRRTYQARAQGSMIGDGETVTVKLFDEGPQGYANIWQMAGCYEYQSCEHDGWREPENIARMVMERIQSRCFRKVCHVELERAPWEFSETPAAQLVP